MGTSETPELLTDDMDIRDTKLSMFVGGNGDYYIALKETKKGEIVKLSTRIAMSGGNASPKVRHSIANLYKALANIETPDETLNSLSELIRSLSRILNKPSTECNSVDFERLKRAKAILSANSKGTQIWKQSDL